MLVGIDNPNSISRKVCVELIIGARLYEKVNLELSRSLISSDIKLSLFGRLIWLGFTETPEKVPIENVVCIPNLGCSRINEPSETFDPITCFI